MDQSSSFINRLTEALDTENYSDLDSCLHEMLEKDKDALRKFRVKNTRDSILHLAVRTKSVAILRIVLEFADYIDMFAQNHREDTCLGLACRINEIPLDVIVVLVKAEPKLVNFPGSFKTFPLHLAVQHHRPDIVKALVEGNSFLNHQNCFKETALHLAAFRLRDTVFEHEALRYDPDNVEVMRFLQEKGASVDIEDYNGKTPFQLTENVVVKCDDLEAMEYHDYLQNSLLAYVPYKKSFDFHYFQYVFKFLYLAIKGCRYGLAKGLIEKYYLDAAYNPHLHKLVQAFVEHFHPRSAMFYVCLMLHDNCKSYHENLRHYISDISCRESFVRFLTGGVFRASIACDIKQQILKSILCELQNNGIDFTSWPLAQYLARLNLDTHNLQQIFDLYKLLFDLNLGINFNVAGIEFIWKYCRNKTGTRQYCILELLLPFTSNIFIDVSLLFKIFDDFDHFLPPKSAETPQFFQQLTHFNEYFSYNCCQNLTKANDNFTFGVHSLKQVCRNKIRHRILQRKHGDKMSDLEFVSSVMQLPLPMVLKKYLRFMDHLEFLNL